MATYDKAGHERPDFKKGCRVFDRCTRQVGTIEKVKWHNFEDDGERRREKYVFLTGVPASDNYPDGWRHQGECSLSMKAIAAADAEGASASGETHG